MLPGEPLAPNAQGHDGWKCRGFCGLPTALPIWRITLPADTPVATPRRALWAHAAVASPGRARWALALSAIPERAPLALLLVLLLSAVGCSHSRRSGPASTVDTFPDCGKSDHRAGLGEFDDVGVPCVRRVLGHGVWMPCLR